MGKIIRPSPCGKMTLAAIILPLPFDKLVRGCLVYRAGKNMFLVISCWVRVFLQLFDLSLMLTGDAVCGGADTIASEGGARSCVLICPVMRATQNLKVYLWKREGKNYKPPILWFRVGFQLCISFPTGNSEHLFQRGDDTVASTVNSMSSLCDLQFSRRTDAYA